MTAKRAMGIKLEAPRARANRSPPFFRTKEALSGLTRAPNKHHANDGDGGGGGAETVCGIVLQGVSQLVSKVKHPFSRVYIDGSWYPFTW